MNARRVCLIVCLFIMVSIVFLYFSFWLPLPDTYTQAIDVDVSPLVGAEILPAEKVYPGTFRVTTEFNRISGGIATHKLRQFSGTDRVLRIERWKARGDGIFDYAFLDITFHKPEIPYSWLYADDKSVWTGIEFQVVFIKNAWLMALYFIVFFVLLAIASLLALAGVKHIAGKIYWR